MLNELSQKIFQANKEKGFWDNERNVGEMLMLVTTEPGRSDGITQKGQILPIRNI